MNIPSINVSGRAKDSVLLALLLAAFLTPPSAQAEISLFDLDFENDALYAAPAQPSLPSGSSGSAKVESLDGSKVLAVRGKDVRLHLPAAKLEKYRRGHQNPTLVTFNLKIDKSAGVIISNQSEENPFTFARILPGGAIDDGGTNGEPTNPKGRLQNGQWQQVYINYDPEWKGYYISFTGPDGGKSEFRRRVKDPSYDFNLAVQVSSGDGAVTLDNFKGITSFIRRNENIRSPAAAAVLFETTLTLFPGRPDLDLRRGTLYQTIKTALPPQPAGDSLLVPALPVLGCLDVKSSWDASSKQLTIHKGATTITLTADAPKTLVNGKEIPLSHPLRITGGNPLVHLTFLAEQLGLKVESLPDRRAIRVTEPGVPYVEPADVTARKPKEPETIIVGADPPAEPRVPLALTYTFTKPADNTKELSWTKTTYKEGPDWKSSFSFRKIQDQMVSLKKKEVWIRFQSTPTPETFSGTYFTTSHDGVLNTFNNGAPLRPNVRNEGKRWLRFFNYITRKDTPGVASQYGLHYIARQEPVIDFALVSAKFKKSTVSPLLRNAGTSSKSFKPVLDISHIRDTRVIKGSDGWYYALGTPFMHGSIPYAQGINDGIELFRSKTRSGPFESVGYVWTFDRAKWANTRYFSADQQRNIWAPELAEINGRWYLSYFPTAFPKNGLKGYSVFQIGIAVADNPLGPYTDTGEFPIIGHPDSHLFQDDDGSVYLTCGNGYIAKLKPAMDALAEAPRFIYPKNGHSIFNEGSTMVKVDGKYYFGGAFSTFYYDKAGKKRIEQTYDCVMAAADHIYGPYGDRFVALKNAGNNSFFKDTDGKWYASIWQPDKVTGIVQVEKLADDTWRPVSDFEEVPSEIRY